MSLIRRREKQVRYRAIGIVHSHRELAPDDLLFLGILLWWQSRVHHRVRQNIERGQRAILRHIDPENSAIERSIGVDVTSDVLDFLRDLISRSGLGSFEEHVLEDMRKAGPKMFILGRAAGRAPRLHTGHWRTAIFLHD